jgi:hypothetical protein
VVDLEEGDARASIEPEKKGEGVVAVDIGAEEGLEDTSEDRPDPRPERRLERFSWNTSSALRSDTSSMVMMTVSPGKARLSHSSLTIKSLTLPGIVKKHMREALGLALNTPSQAVPAAMASRAFFSDQY